MEDSILGEGCVQRWLPARQEGTEMTASLKSGGAGGGVEPCHSGRVRLGRLFSSCSRPPSSDLPLAHSFSSFVQTSPSWGWCPIRNLRGGKGLVALARGVAGNVAGGWVAPCGPTVPQPGGVVADFAQLPPGAPGPGGPKQVVNRPQDPGRLASDSGWGRGSLAGPWVASKFRNLITEWPRK